MPYLKDYIEEYGNKSFDEAEFTEIDALLFSQLAYINYSAIVCSFDTDIKISLAEIAKQFFDLYDENALKNEISIVSKACELLKICATKKRYRDIELLKYENNINRKIDKQFSAINFYLNKNTAVIAFRGTDTSLTGIKEAAMLSYMFPVPAQIEGLYYLQECGMLANRDIIICGHSKGGNLATFAGVSCSNSLKKRILGIYEFDAPGFPEEMINRYDFVKMKSKIHSYIPQTSIIGCMLYHNSDLRIVKSTNEGIRQHQVSSWEIEGDKFINVEETDSFSKFIDKYIKELCENVGEDNIEDMFETIFDILEQSDIDDYDDLKSFEFSRIFRTLRSIKNIDDEKKDIIEETLKKAFRELSTHLYSERFNQFFNRQ